jgi:prepilin-type N-terminal cleavage/methylation domain-containing protein
MAIKSSQSAFAKRYGATQRGFTLIEMLVVIAIVAVVASTLLFNYSTFSTDVSVRNLAEDMALSVRKAQSYATSVHSIDGTADITSDTYPAYGVSFSTIGSSNVPYAATDTNFALFADVSPDGKGDTSNTYGNDGICGSPTSDGTQECLESLALTGGNTIVSLCTDAPVANSCFTPTNTGTVNVVFHRPNPDAVICVVGSGGNCIDQEASYLKVTVQSVKGIQRIITIWNTGQISVD